MKLEHHLFMDFALFIMIWRMHACKRTLFLDLMLGWKNQPGLIFHSAGLGPVSALKFCIFEFASLMQCLIIPGAGYDKAALRQKAAVRGRLCYRAPVSSISFRMALARSRRAYWLANKKGREGPFYYCLE